MRILCRPGSNHHQLAINNLLCMSILANPSYYVTLRSAIAPSLSALCIGLIGSTLQVPAYRTPRHVMSNALAKLCTYWPNRPMSHPNNPQPILAKVSVPNSWNLNTAQFFFHMRADQTKGRDP